VGGGEERGGEGPGGERGSDGAGDRGIGFVRVCLSHHHRQPFFKSSLCSALCGKYIRSLTCEKVCQGGERARVERALASVPWFVGEQGTVDHHQSSHQQARQQRRGGRGGGGGGRGRGGGGRGRGSGRGCCKGKGSGGVERGMWAPGRCGYCWRVSTAACSLASFVVRLAVGRGAGGETVLSVR
jgi:hypothetical protein